MNPASNTVVPPSHMNIFSCTYNHLNPMQKKKDEPVHELPRDFIEKQRAYFAEIDAFELSEEEVESVDQLD